MPSVHLTKFPLENNLPYSAEIIQLIDKIQAICNTGLAIRNANNIRIRQPLNGAEIFVEKTLGQQLEPYSDIIRDELNLKQVFFKEFEENLVEKKIYIDRPKLGKRLGSQLKEVITAVANNSWEKASNDEILIEGIRIFPDEYKIIIQQKGNPKASLALPTNDILVALDVNLDENLINEGLARDLIRLIQQSRKEAKLNITDRIRLNLQAEEKFLNSIKNFTDFIKEQTLVEELSFSYAALTHTFDNLAIEDFKIAISFKKV
jgi:isoleucyl-tRNA synthetase